MRSIALTANHERDSVHDSGAKGEYILLLAALSCSVCIYARVCAFVTKHAWGQDFSMLLLHL